MNDYMECCSLADMLLLGLGVGQVVYSEFIPTFRKQPAAAGNRVEVSLNGNSKVVGHKTKTTR